MEFNFVVIRGVQPGLSNGELSWDDYPRFGFHLIRVDFIEKCKGFGSFLFFELLELERI